MNVKATLRRGVLWAAIAAGAVAPANATTMIRQSLDDLTGSSSRIVVGDVLETHSYWNQDGTHILTDVRFVASEVLKGDLGDLDFTITLPGGWVGDQGIVFVGGAELIQGRSYLLFLNETRMPGGARALTVRDFVQGAFDLGRGPGGTRAVSQAVRHPLLSDRAGQVEPPGGREGMPYEALVGSIREIVERQGGSRREVQ